MNRYVVRELEGWAITNAGAVGGGRPPGLSVYVMDAEDGYRVLRTWRTEEHQWRGRQKARDFVREAAVAYAAQLNAEEEQC